MRISAFAAIILLATLHPARAADPLAKTGDQSTAGMAKVTRHSYVNNNYGYSLDVPAELTAWMNRPPAPNHGFRIFLGPRRSIEVNADHDGALLGSTAAVAADAAEALSPGSITKSADVLGGLPAEKLWLAGPGDRRVVLVAQWTTDADRLSAARLAPKSDGKIHPPSSNSAGDQNVAQDESAGRTRRRMQPIRGDADEAASAVNVVISLETTASAMKQDERLLSALSESFRYIHQTP